MYDKEKLLSLLTDENYKAVDPNGNAFPPSNPIYQEISNKMAEESCNITPKHIYTILKNDRSGILVAVRKAFSINQSFRCEDNLKNDSINTTVQSENGRSIERFVIILSPENWAAIAPEVKNYANRKYVALKSGTWSHILADKIWDQKRLPCAFSFKNCRVYTRANSSCFARFSATCKECDASLKGFLYQKPRKKRDVSFECTVTGRDPKFPHRRKRQLKGYLREQVASVLVDGKKAAATWRTEQATQLMSFGDKIPPFLYDATVLRKAKQEELDNRLGLSNTDPIANLQAAKYDRCIGRIHNIGKDPFHCMYWSEEQLTMCKLDKKVAGKKTWYMSLDATGGVGKKIKLPNGEKSPHIFLYQCLSITKERSIPVFQMVSCKQDSVFIEYFLLEILRSGAPIPRMVVTDFGSALLVALARAFSNCTDLKHYMQVCYDKIFTQSPTIKLKCYLRLDVSHFIAMIARWECLRKKLPKARQFYIRSLAHAYKMQHYDELSTFLQSLLTVALSEEVGRDEKGMRVPSEHCLRQANSIIKGTECEEKIDEGNDNDMEDTHTAKSWQQLSFSILDKAKAAASSSTRGNTVNAFYNPDAAEKIRKLITQLPLWTGLMRGYFEIGDDVATSSSAEAEFSDLKGRAFERCLPMRIDKFVIQHLDYLDGKMRLACGQTMTTESGDHSWKPDLEKVDLDAPITEPILADEDSNNKYSSFNADENFSKLRPNRQVVSLEDSTVITSNDDYRNGDSFCDEEGNLFPFQTEPKIEEFNLDNSITRPTPYDSDIKDSWSNGAEDLLELSLIRQDISLKDSKTISSDENDESGNSPCIKERNPLDFKENWRGLESKAAKQQTAMVKSEQPIKRRKKPTYLDDCPDWDSLNMKNSIGLPLMRNGSLCSAVTVNGIKMVVRRTCAFDSVVQIIAHALALFDSYQIATAAIDNPTIRLAESILSRGKVCQPHYAKRAEILLSLGIFTLTSFTRNFSCLDTKCNAAHLAEKLLTNPPTLLRHKACTGCRSEITRSHLSISVNINILLQHGLGHVQNAIDDVLYDSNMICNNCGSNLNVTEIYGPHLMIDTSALTDPNYLKCVGDALRTYELDSIARQVVVRGKNYELAGAASYQRAKEHYVALVNSNLYWYEYDDLHKKRSQIPATTQFVPHVLIYVSK